MISINHVRRSIENPPPLPPFDTPALLSAIENRIVSGALTGVFWTGDWKSKLSKALETIRLPLDSMLSRPENNPTESGGIRSLLRVVSFSRLMEEAMHAREALISTRKIFRSSSPTIFLNDHCTR